MKVTDEMRDKMVTSVLVFGKGYAQTAHEIGCNAATVQKTVEILRMVKGGAMEAVEKNMISSRCGINLLEWAFRSCGKPAPAEMTERIRAALSIAKAPTKEDSKAEPPKEEPKPEPPKPISPEQTPTGAKTFIPAPTAEAGWQTRIKTNPGRVCMTVYFNGVPVVEGLSRIKSNTELDLMQAISYAAHMCYKLTEQKKLKGV